MQLGEKIRELRKNSHLSQEELAEKINVSRSAVAKWESNHGIPDITNLKKLSEVFSVSVDSLIDYTKDLESDISNPKEVCSNSKYVGGVYDIDLVGWNDGVYNAYILNEDEKFLYYLIRDKGKKIHGLIAKKYIKKIEPVSTKGKLEVSDESNINLAFFYNKKVSIYLSLKEGILGFFDFENDDYSDKYITSINNQKVILDYGGEIDIDKICKIEEVPD